MPAAPRRAAAAAPPPQAGAEASPPPVTGPLAAAARSRGRTQRATRGRATSTVYPRSDLAIRSAELAKSILKLEYAARDLQDDHFDSYTLYVDPKHYRPPSVAASKAASITNHTWRNISCRALALAQEYQEIFDRNPFTLEYDSLGLPRYPSTLDIPSPESLTPRIGNVLTLPLVSIQPSGTRSPPSPFAIANPCFHPSRLTS